ncbi:hypothetical protein C8F04DRAFT_1272686 [Mycena alexandri]|uniref:DUF6533 domain-containing protein n=1 Tax=Mycena alexandri TaxID=1745969 RepID=A0AAD6S8W1_9AGAR|nr:hypothetical protein C8F04DRAFT_1272686 [Mycena alexandri]
MDAAAAAQLLHDAIVGLENVAVTRYISTAGFVEAQVLLYDHLLTLDGEVEYIWAAPNTAAKVLFLILRYMVPLFLTAETVTLTQIQTYAGWLSIVISNLLVLLRICTTLPRGHRLISWSMYFFIVMQLASLGVTTWVVTNMIPVLVFEPIVGLCTFSNKPNVVGLWLPGLVFEVVVFGTVWWNALDRPRSVGTDSQEGQITRVLARDGVIYFVIMFGLRIANTVIAIIAPISSLFIIVFFIWAGTTVTTSRLIINARREAGEREKMAELNELGYSEYRRRAGRSESLAAESIWM